MLTIDLEPALETTLQNLAQQAHLSPSKMIEQLIHFYLQKQQQSELLIDIVKTLPRINGFGEQNPLEIQQALRNEWP
jgi:hypothetical protein